MKHAAMKSVILGSVMGAGLVVSSASMAGDLSGNVGMVTEYIFRGVPQSNATGSAGLDYDFGNGLSLGTWGADVGDGLEVDVYGSYSGEVKDFSYSAGFTTYNYTGNFDDTYKEINLGAGFGPVSVAFAKGNYETDPDTLDYSFVSATFEQGGAYVTYGKWGGDLADVYGKFVQVGYGTEVGGFDTGISIVNVDKKVSGTTNDSGNPTSDMTMVFSLGKSFDL